MPAAKEALNKNNKREVLGKDKTTKTKKKVFQERKRNKNKKINALVKKKEQKQKRKVLGKEKVTKTQILVTETSTKNFGFSF
jgi:hypothetical protein